MNQVEKSSKKCPICGRPPHKESIYCIFHAKAEEKTEKDFKDALKEYVNRIKEKNGDCNFVKFIFIGDIIDFKKDLNIKIFKNAIFSGATFEGHVFFLETIFKGKADFFRTTFKGDIYFSNVSFEGKADFLRAKIEGKADFTGATFKENTDFRNTIFAGNAYFSFAVFEGKADFTEATLDKSSEFKGTTFKADACFESTNFKGDTIYFTNAIFEGDANFFVVSFKGNSNFVEATFKRGANFEQAIFESDVDFRVNYFNKKLNLSKIKTFSGNKLFVKLNNKEGEISFERASLENIYLDMELVRGVLIDFTDALLRNTKVKKDQIESHILQEKEKKFSEAREIYLILKNNFHSIGHYNDESWAFKKEKDMERKNYCHFRTLHQWLWYCFLNAIFGYGEKPWNAILSAGILIFTFALLFSFIGIGNPEIIELKGTAIHHQDVENIVDLESKGLLKNDITRNFPDSLYFSLITFTTLGYGDFRPLEGIGRILAGSEAFIGAFIMALFVYTFARRTGGR